MVLPYSPRIPRVPGYSGNPTLTCPFTRTGLSPLSSTLSIVCSAYDRFNYSAPHPHNAVTSWVWARTSSIASTKVFTCCFLFLRLLRCFSSPGSLLSLERWYAVNVPGCPIQISADQCLFATPRSFSQLITSFFASWSLGIRHPPLSTFFKVINIFFGLFVVNCQLFIVN